VKYNKLVLSADLDAVRNFRCCECYHLKLFTTTDIKQARENNLARGEQGLLQWVMDSVLSLRRPGHKNLYYAIGGRPVCRKAWLLFHGISGSKLQHAMDNVADGIVDNPKQTRTDDAEKRTWARAWLGQYLHLDVDPQVNTLLLHYLYWPAVWSACAQAWLQDPKRPGHGPPSIKMLKNLKRNEFRHIHEPKAGHWQRCHRCGVFTHDIAHATGDARLRLQKEYQQHRDSHHLERGVMEQAMREAVLNPASKTLLFADLTNPATIPNVEPTYNVAVYMLWAVLEA